MRMALMIGNERARRIIPCIEDNRRTKAHITERMCMNKRLCVNKAVTNWVETSGAMSTGRRHGVCRSIVPSAS